jgi:hypothetical protein
MLGKYLCSTLLNYVGLFYFTFRTVRFLLCLKVTHKCISSYQFIVSLSCSYMFRQLCTILRELVCTFWVTCQSGFLVDKILCGLWICVYILWRPGACRSVFLCCQVIDAYYTEFYQPNFQICTQLGRCGRAHWRWHTVAETCRSS